MMDIELIDFSKYGKTYQSFANNLIKLIRTESESDIEKYFEQFNSKYTIIPELWKFWIEKCLDGEESSEIKQQLSKNIALNSLKHFLSEDFIKYFYGIYESTISERSYFKKLLRSPFVTIFDDEYERKDITKVLCFPHWKLKEVFEICLKDSDRPIDAKIMKQYKNSLDLYGKLEAADEKKCVELLMESNDKEFITQNIESRIAKNPSNVEMWKLYLKYLKEVNVEVEEMLNVYSRYCRLFLDDNKMRQEYCKQINQYLQGSRARWWFDVIKLENMVVSSESAWTLMLSIAKAQLHLEANVINFENFEKYANKFEQNRLQPFSKKLIIAPRLTPKFTFTKPFRQCFNFPFFMMKYILKTQKYTVLQNLFMTCKYFFPKRSILICHKLEIKNMLYHRNPDYFQHSLMLSRDGIEKLNGEKMCVSNALKINYPNDVDVFSTVLSKIKYWSIKHLTLKHQNFLIRDWQKIISGNRLDSCYLNDCRIQNDSGKLLTLEEIFKHLPWVQDFTFKTTEDDSYTPQTSQLLLQMERKGKLKNFEIKNVPISFNPFNYGEFIKKNGAPNASFKIHFIAEMDWQMRNEFFTIVNRILAAHWMPENEKPIINYNNFKDFI